MKKIFLSAFILMDLGLIIGSGFVLFTYVQKHLPLKPLPSGFSSSSQVPAVSTLVTPAVSVGSSSTTVKTAASAITAPAAGADNSVRKILFSYRNPHAKQVSIRADFTGWKAAPMVKGANGSWTYTVPLTPGEYAYIYAVDDKTLKDPANKRTKQIGRTLVSAILVEPKK